MLYTSVIDLTTFQENISGQCSISATRTASLESMTF